MTSYEFKPIKDATKDYDRCAYEYVSCCYANGNGEKRSVYNRRLKSMERSDALKYFEIIKDSVRGTINKNAFVTGFSDAQKGDNGLKQILKTAVREPLNEENTVELFDRIIPTISFANETNYFITVSNNTIDYKPKTSDHLTIDDASEFSFSYIIVAVCPAKLSDPGLAYDEESGEFRTRVTDWVAGSPFMSFVYPVPAGNGADMDHAIVFSKSKEYEDAASFMEKLMGDENPPKPSDQVFDSLVEIVTNTFEEKLTPDQVEILDSGLAQFKQDYKEDHRFDIVLGDQLPPEPSISKEELKSIIKATGASEEEVKAFEDEYETRLGEEAIPLYGVKPLEKALNKATVLVKTENPGALETRTIDGEQYLLIPFSAGIKLNNDIL